MLNQVNSTTTASTMISAAERSLEQNGGGSQAILQCLQIEVATVDPYPLRCFSRDQPMRGSFPTLRNGFHNGFPFLFHISDLFARITNSVGILEVRQVGSDIGDIAIP